MLLFLYLSFFENTYYSVDYIKDSVRFNKLNNVLQLKQYENANRKASFGKRAFLGVDFINTTTPGLDSTKFAGLDTTKFESLINNSKNINYTGLR